MQVSLTPGGGHRPRLLSADGLKIPRSARGQMRGRRSSGEGGVADRDTVFGPPAPTTSLDEI